MAETRNSLSFQGKGSTLFGRYLVNILLSLVTLGIYSFWGKVKILQYQYEQTQLNGSPFLFLGTGKQMFFGFLKFLGILLVTYLIIIVAALSLFLFTALGEVGYVLWFLVYFVVVMVLTGLLVPMAVNGRLRYRLRVSSWRGLTGVYRGKNKELIPLYLKGLFLTVITLGIYGAWFSVRLRKYLYGKMAFGNLKVEFRGTGGELFVLGLKGILLTILTLGIYGFWYARNLYRWSAAKTVVVQNGQDHPLSTPVTPGALFKFWVPNLLLLVVTLGLAFPWFSVNSWKFFFANLTLPDTLDLDTLTQGETGTGDATGENLGDFLDLGDFGIL